MSEFDKHYPHITAWIQQYNNRIEIGGDDFSSSLIRVLDQGGMIWESEQNYDAIDDALADADQAIAE